mmetsp:Transcript_53463/g.153405  ORF Transcript_53463/g.153405 Transcript_53463/m.153405 type:complete len:519 (-) Transcript_53463:105-1661(-)
MQVQVLQNGLDGVGELKQLQRQFPLRGVLDPQLAHRQLLRLDLALPLDGPDPCIRIEQEDCRVALGVQHLVVVEDVVGGSVLLHVEVPDGRDAKFLGRVLLVLGVLEEGLGARLVLRLYSALDLLRGPEHGLVQEVNEFDRFAGPGLESFLVFALHHAEAHVVQPGDRRPVPAGLHCGVEDHVEVCLLAKIGEVHDPIGPHDEEPVVDRRQIRGVVAEASVALDCHQRDVGNPRAEDAHRAFALDAETPGLELLDQRRDHVVVERLSPLLGPDVQPLVDLVEGLPADVADPLPGRARELAAALQVHNCFLRLLLEVLVLVEPLLGSLVERIQVAHVRHAACALEEAGVGLLHELDEHTELSAPIADVVQSVHLMAAELQNPAQGLPQDGGPQVANVHLLGDVRRGKVHDHPLRAGGVRVLDLVADNVPNLPGEPAVVELDGHEALGRDHDVREDIVLGEPLLDGLCQTDRLGEAQRLAVVLEQPHSIVALVVAELGIALDDLGLLLNPREGASHGLVE